MAKTADGVEFTLGMTLYRLVESAMEFLEYKTSPETHELESFEYDGRTVVCLGRKGSSISTEITHFFLSKRAAVAYAIDCHLSYINDHQCQILDLEELAREVDNA